MEIKKATVVYILKENRKRVLMIEGIKTYAPHYGKYNGVVGKFEPIDDENPEACATREVEEESGYTAEELNLIGKIRSTGMFPEKEFIVYYYTCEKFSGEQREDPEQGPLVWAEIGEDGLPDVPILDGDKIFFPWIMADKKFEATFYYNDREYLRHEVTFKETEIPKFDKR